ncbi:MAG: FAD-dependent oxidoreductase [Hyphomicrobiales bacterium]
MNDAAVGTDTNIVRRAPRAEPWRVKADICVVGAGIAGTSAAIEAARLGRRVVLVDGLPVLGGQAVNSIIGTFCGLFANGTHGHQFTHGIADDIIRTLGSNKEQLYFRHGPHTTVVYYDEVALARWIEETVRGLGITVVLGAVLRRVEMDGRRVRRIELATRYGDVHVEATGFVDSSGDAALVWQAGLPCREPANSKVFGTQMVVLEHIDEARQPTRDQIAARMKEKGEAYGLVRREGLGFIIPGRGIAAMNMTHVETPLDPLEASARTLDGRDQADRAVRFLQAEFPEAFGKARVRAYGFPGIRQTRWIVGRQQLTVEDVRAGTRFSDAIGRTAWPIELHDHGSGHHWHVFPEDHVHYIRSAAWCPPRPTTWSRPAAASMPTRRRCRASG